MGSIRGYSSGKECDHVNHDWTCYFLPMSNNQKELLARGKREVAGFKAIDGRVIPSQFAHMGIAWWWGIIQSYMFRLQPNIQELMRQKLELLDNGRGFPSGRIAGLHVRHGDKVSSSL
jgi:hypothetical protein